MLCRMSERVDIAIIGAGAAGLATAIFAAQAARAGRRDCRIALLDGAKTIGAKILVAGGGRCNVTHHRVTTADYHGSRNRVKKVLAAFNVEKTRDWFQSLGVHLKQEDTGKLFPTTDSARTVLNALVNRCLQLKVDVLADHRVTGIKGDGEQLVVTHSHGQVTADHVVLATGGKSLPKTGSDGFGYQLAKALGHTVTPTHPALAPLVLDNSFFHRDISGVSHEAELSTFVDCKRIDQRTGSMLWTHFGISGPVVMDASRFWIIANAQGKQAELRASLLPGETFETLEKWLIDLNSSVAKRSVVRVLSERLPQRVATALCDHLQINSDVTVGQLSRDRRRSLVHALNQLPLPVVRDRGWNAAEVTAGGVPLEEIDTATMRSRLMPNLYLVGEIIDVDGRIGGFNFQWAWATGHIAGTHMATTQR